MQVSGLHYTFDPDKPVGNMIVSASVNSTPILKDKSYSIATNNYVGGHLPELLGVQLSSVTQQDLKVNDRNVYIESIQRKQIITSRIEGRVINIKSTEPVYDTVD